MKSNMFLVASLLILVGMGAITVSCKKEQVAKYRKAEICVSETNAKDGGDDEDPIVQGKVKKNGFPVDSAYVETIVASSNVKVGEKYTNDRGEFEQQVEAGVYYFKVLVPGEEFPYITDTIHVDDDREVTIFVD